MYPIISKYHRLPINYGNKIPMLPGYLCYRWQNISWYMYHVSCTKLETCTIACASWTSDCLHGPRSVWKTADQWPLVVRMEYSRGTFINSLRPRQIGRQFPDDNIFKCIFLTENVVIPIKISLKFVPEGSNNNIPTLVQIMAWRPPCNKPLYEPMMVRLSTYIYVTQPQWVNMVLV